MGQQNSCKTLIGVHSTMHFMHPIKLLLGVFDMNIHDHLVTQSDHLFTTVWLFMGHGLISPDYCCCPL